MPFPKHVTLVEVSPRDGLQNESQTVPTDIKVQFIELLADSGLSVIETTSFVSPKWIPQLADHHPLFQKIPKRKNIRYPILIPNLKGLKEALTVDVHEIAVFTTPSEKFCQRNTNCSVEESLDRIAEVMVLAKEKKLHVRGYLSCVLGCPYEGYVAPEKTAALAEKLINLGCDEIALGDTIGVGTPKLTIALIKTVSKKVPLQRLGVHFHDTYGQALANIYVALECGIAIVDSAVAGLGGCPYAKGAAGNVASEDVLYLLHGLGIETGVDLSKLIEAGQFISKYLGKEVQSKVSRACRVA